MLNERERTAIGAMEHERIHSQKKTMSKNAINGILFAFVYFFLLKQYYLLFYCKSENLALKNCDDG